VTSEGSTLIDASDELLVEMLRDAELPSLMPALAYVTGDMSLVADDIRPPRQAAAVVVAAQGGMSPEQQAIARDRALGALRRLRDHGGVLAAPLTAIDGQRSLLEFMTGEVDDRYLPMLAFELGVPDDVDAPTWRKPLVAPDREFTVAIIGAGMSGLAMAHRLQQAGVDFIAFERNSDVGGVWLENDYPGCRLDTSNFCYSYSFSQRDDWPHQYSLRSEIHDYFRTVADQLALRERIKFRTEVLAAVFDDTADVWHVTVRDEHGVEETLRVQAVISAVGQLNTPSFPDIPGRAAFAGQSFHSARWDKSVDLTGKRVGVIGTGASAYQVVPSIAAEVGEMHLFQRNPPWTVATAIYHAKLAPGLAWLFKHVPYYHRWFRFYQFWTSVEGRRDFASVDPSWHKPGSVSAKNEELRETLIARLLSEYEGRPDLQAKVIPSYPPYGKRMLRDNGVWAKTLKQDNVALVTEAIEKITPTGIVTKDGNHHELDVLIYCTGFRAVDLLSSVEITGRGGIALHEQWGDEPTAYIGITIPNFPNLFCIYGPNTNLVVNGSTFMFSECAAHYIQESLRFLLEGGHRTMEVRPEVLEKYQVVVDEANALMAWGVEGVRNWYKTPSGRVSTNWPLTTLEYWDRTRAPVPQDYQVT
jgi:4-hydroxyacetophenone monooxygenase